jgi:hypothetical protein
MKNIQKILEIPGKFLEIDWDTRSPNKISKAHEKDFSLINIFNSRRMRIIFQKILENSRKTLLIDEHILKDTYILKLNILGCDN